MEGSSDIQRISDALRYAFESSDKLSNTEENMGKLKYKANPRWITESDIQEHAEDARIVASRIFLFIQYLAKLKYRVTSFWIEPRVTAINEQQMDYITDICEVLLERLQKKRFF